MERGGAGSTSELKKYAPVIAEVISISLAHSLIADVTWCACLKEGKGNLIIIVYFISKERSFIIFDVRI